MVDDGQTYAGADPEKMTRIEAAAYMTTKGFKVVPTTLAKYVGEGTGPVFHKEHGRVTYKVADLDAWLKSGGADLRKARTGGGRPRKTVEPKGDLLSVLEDFLELVEHAVAGVDVTFADGIKFARQLDELKRLMAKRKRNGVAP